jgi:hypothetical protein
MVIAPTMIPIMYPKIVRISIEDILDDVFGVSTVVSGCFRW